MTAEPRPALRAVSADTIGRGEAVAAQWEPQHQFVGALLWQTATAAGPLLAIVPADAIVDPLTRWVYELVTGLVADGRDPHPPAVLHRAKTQPAAGALRPGRPSTEREFHRLATHLADLYTRVLDPSAANDHAHDVLDDAYRRAVHAAGGRLQQLADSYSDAEELAAAVATTCGALTRSATPAVTGDASPFGSPRRRAHRC